MIRLYASEKTLIGTLNNGNFFLIIKNFLRAMAKFQTKLRRPAEPLPKLRSTGKKIEKQLWQVLNKKFGNSHNMIAIRCRTICAYFRIFSIVPAKDTGGQKASEGYP